MILREAPLPHDVLVSVIFIPICYSSVWELGARKFFAIYHAYSFWELDSSTPQLALQFWNMSVLISLIVFSGPMFRSLGVAKDCTLLAGLSCGCTILFYLLYFYGASLRAGSRFAVE